MLDRKFILVFVFSIILEAVVHEALINDDDLEMDHKRVLKPNIMAIKKLLEDRGYVLIPGQIMKELLIQFGATEEDFRVLESGYIHRYLPLDQQPVMRHRLVNIFSNSKGSLSLTFIFRTRVTVFCTTQRISQSSPRTPTPSPSIQAMR